ncbi:hypothetical protein EZS27_013079 [termite gut metagenome]|uniref:Calcineurin-like phosphoesterase domain-containing protein n=1 Tax=termite gut metagenome TaxID=433724 RepID=A0A5J4RY78_9ZZZZ
MKCIVFSDLHGHLPHLDNSHLVILAGDIAPLSIHHNINATVKWFYSKFVPYLLSMKTDFILIVGGNHDFFLEENPNIFDDLNDSIDSGTININGHQVALNNTQKLPHIIYFDGNTSPISIGGKSFYGMPYTRKHSGNDAFAFSEAKLRVLYTKIPHSIDVLISHDSPFNPDFQPDDNVYGRSFDESFGSVPLFDAIQKRNIKYCFSGHIHSERQDSYLINKTQCFNVGLVEDDSYAQLSHPLVINI